MLVSDFECQDSSGCLEPDTGKFTCNRAFAVEPLRSLAEVIFDCGWLAILLVDLRERDGASFVCV